MSTITVSNIKKTGETASRDVSGVAAAWAFFNAVGPSLDGSLNVSSITDIAVGRFELNWTNTFSDALYSSVGAGRSEVLTGNSAIQTTSKVRIGVNNPSTGASVDDTNNSTAHFGDLA